MSLGSIDQAIANEEASNASLTSEITARNQQIAQLQSMVSSLQQQIAAAQAAYRAAHPTVSSYGPWSACGSDGQQTRHVVWSNGTVTLDTRACTPPVTCYTYKHFLHFDSATCQWVFDREQKCSNGTLTDLGRVTETDPNCTVSSHPGGGIQPTPT